MRLPVIKRKFFSGTNQGDTITEVPVPEEHELWTMPLPTKRALYDKYRVPVGGKEESSSEGESENEESQV